MVDIACLLRKTAFILEKVGRLYTRFVVKLTNYCSKVFPIFRMLLLYYVAALFPYFFVTLTAWNSYENCRTG
jgi:hypothetical protein